MAGQEESNNEFQQNEKLPYEKSQCRRAVAAIIENIGFSYAKKSSIDALTHIMRVYFEQLCRNAIVLAEQAGREEVTFDDALQAIEENDVTLTELHDYLRQVAAFTSEQNVPLFPVRRKFETLSMVEEATTSQNVETSLEINNEPSSHKETSTTEETVTNVENEITSPKAKEKSVEKIERENEIEKPIDETDEEETVLQNNESLEKDAVLRKFPLFNGLPALLLGINTKKIPTPQPTIIKQINSPTPPFLSTFINIQEGEKEEVMNEQKASPNAQKLLTSVVDDHQPFEVTNIEEVTGQQKIDDEKRELSVAEAGKSPMLSPEPAIQQEAVDEQHKQIDIIENVRENEGTDISQILDQPQQQDIIELKTQQLPSQIVPKVKINLGVAPFSFSQPVSSIEFPGDGEQTSQVVEEKNPSETDAAGLDRSLIRLISQMKEKEAKKLETANKEKRKSTKRKKPKEIIVEEEAPIEKEKQRRKKKEKSADGNRIKDTRSPKRRKIEDQEDATPPILIEQNFLEPAKAPLEDTNPLPTTTTTATEELVTINKVSEPPSESPTQPQTPPKLPSIKLKIKLGQSRPSLSQPLQPPQTEIVPVVSPVAIASTPPQISSETKTTPGKCEEKHPIDEEATAFISPLDNTQFEPTSSLVATPSTFSVGDDNQKTDIESETQKPGKKKSKTSGKKGRQPKEPKNDSNINEKKSTKKHKTSKLKEEEIELDESAHLKRPSSTTLSKAPISEALKDEKEETFFPTTSSLLMPMVTKETSQMAKSPDLIGTFTSFSTLSPTPSEIVIPETAFNQIAEGIASSELTLSIAPELEEIAMPHVVKPSPLHTTVDTDREGSPPAFPKSESLLGPSSSCSTSTSVRASVEKTPSHYSPIHERRSLTPPLLKTIQQAKKLPSKTTIKTPVVSRGTTSLFGTPPTKKPPKGGGKSSAKTSTPVKASVVTATKKTPAKASSQKAKAKPPPVFVPPAAAEDEEEIWICPECSVAYVEGGAPMICCDDCDCWYHWSCVGIEMEPPKNKEWFCNECIRIHKKSNAESAASVSSASRRPSSSSSSSNKKKGSGKKK